MPWSRLTALALALAACVAAQSFVISNGQIYTPGFAIVDAPQPGTPEGGGMIDRLMIFGGQLLPAGRSLT